MVYAFSEVAIVVKTKETKYKELALASLEVIGHAINVEGFTEK